MKRLHVAVLMGGPSAEREVSLQSGSVVVQALLNAGTQVCEVDVRGPDFWLSSQVDVAFIALHGTFGEDGQIQRILEERGVPYTGSGPAASALAFDKSAAKSAFIAAGIPTPAHAVIERDLTPIAALSLPLVIKPARQGSSVGISIVNDRAELQEACAQAWRYDERLIAEQFIRGRELTVGILGDKALPIIEISTRRTFFDYQAKYTPGEAEEIVPAPLDRLTAARVQELALRAHECLGCRDFSRVDVMLSTSGELSVLEVNTIPGLTANSLLPKAARACGLSMQDVCLRMAEMALARRDAAVPVVG
jgi:D-alanine-D-alanine ligase